MQQEELEKVKVYRFVDIAQQVPGTSTTKAIIKRTTGVLNSLTMDVHQLVDTPLSPFDTYIHVIDGRVEITRKGISLFLDAGEFVIIPGHVRTTSRALQPSRLLHLTIKSGYEDLV